MAIGRLLRGETAARAVPPRMPSPLGSQGGIQGGRRRGYRARGARYRAGGRSKVVPIAVETDRKCGLNTPRAIVCDGRRFEIARVGATLPCPSMFGKADATVTGVLVDVGGRCVARGLICDDGLWFSVKPDG